MYLSQSCYTVDLIQWLTDICILVVDPRDRHRRINAEIPPLHAKTRLVKGAVVVSIRVLSRGVGDVGCCHHGPLCFTKSEFVGNAVVQ